ncbi:alpha/beta hydrolase [Streptomyces sp. SAJ15]|uniref:alpha/beta hydrolase n=1 Tax=Streptomyces sp. SAJ15 TaxID=2011095 RepID=UPI00118563DF|nr:alpha/beta hydrolase [Streptomyces sp. SAJ15]TVL89487.1 protease [Streptomyces sp. SAJ15]
MTPALRRTAVLTALTACAAVLPPAAHPAAAPTTTGATTTGGIAFGPCPASVPTPAPPDRVECGTLRVPLDHRRPHGRHLDIAVSRVPASGTPAERRGILLVNPGGPGGAGLSYAVTKRAKLPERVRRGYDVIGFDPRGTGRSAPADCGPMGGLFAADAPGADPVPRGPAAERAHLAALRRMAADCAAGVGKALPHLSTRETAHDMEAIRTALGEPKLSFLGVSYGSYLGAAYAARYPHRTGRMVLDSVVGPEDWYDFDLRQARALLAQRTRLFGWLARHHDRFGLGDTAAEVRAGYARVRAELTARPVDGFGAAAFDRAVYRTLGRTERWAPFGEGLRGYLREGTVAGLRPGVPFDGPDSRTYEAANRTVKCADGPGPKASRLLPELRRLRRLDPLPVVTGLEADVCAYWPHRPAARTRLGGPNVPPVLLVASEHDPVTPVAGAHRLRRALPGSRLVTLYDDYSHGVFASRGDACVDGTVAAYLVDGSVPARDVRCAGAGLP